MLVCFRAGMRSAVSGVNAYFQPRKLKGRAVADQKTRNLRSIFGESLVGVAVQPMLSRLRRCDHRMTTGVRVFAGVLIRRAVATQRDAARLARPEMHPIGTDLYAFFTFATMRLLDRLNRDRIQMSTTSDIHDRLT